MMVLILSWMMSKLVRRAFNLLSISKPRMLKEDVVKPEFWAEDEFGVVYVADWDDASPEMVRKF